MVYLFLFDWRFLREMPNRFKQKTEFFFSKYATDSIIIFIVLLSPHAHLIHFL